MAKRGRNSKDGWRVAIIGLLLAAVMLLALAPGRPARAQLPAYQVLVLNSYHHGLSWTDNIVEGIYAGLDMGDQEVELYLEYMDTKRLPPTADYYEQLAALYQIRFADIDFDAIIVADNDAFNFIREYHVTLFPRVPVIFCGVNFFEPSMLYGFEQYFTGVVENVDIRDTLEVALALHPDTTRFVVVNDDTTTGWVYQDLLETIIPLYLDRVEFVIYDNPSMPELFAALEAQPDPENTLILMILLNRDRDGNFYTYEQSITLLRQNTDIPIYGLWDFYLYNGLVGGKLINAFSQGEAAGRMTMQVLQGASPRDLPVQTESPNRYMFDYLELQRLGIGLNQLPAGSEVVNRPVTFLEQYQGVLVGGMVALLVFAAIFTLQWTNLRRQREIESALREANRELATSREELEVRVEQRTSELARRSEQLAAAAQVVREAVGIRNVDELLNAIVNLISQRFGFYHAGIFLIDAAGEYAVLSAASSEGGARMLARGHRLRVGVGIVGSVLMTGEPRIALDVGEDAVWFNNPDLPLTRSELGLPLTVRGKVIGVLNVQSEEPEAFAREDIVILETLAEQVAMAIDNARLLEESQRAIGELERLYGESVGRAWQRVAEEQALAYRYTGVNVERVAVEAAVGMSDALTPELAERHLAVDVKLRDQVLASIDLQRDPDLPPWTQEERLLVEALSAQAALALENARLIDQTLRRAEQEQVVRQAADEIRAAVNIEDAIKRALKQLQQLLGAAELVARLAPPETASLSQEGE